MTDDLDETLRGLGPGYREVVGRLLAARETPSRFRALHFGPIGRCLVAASAAIAAVGFAAFFAFAPSRCASQAASFGGEYRLALVADDASLREIIRTQNADGSWKTAFLTKRNAAALRGMGTEEARVAYKKAMRNLRIRRIL